MRTTLTTLAFCFFLVQSFGQTQRKLSTYLHANYNQTLQDYTRGNNPWSIGLSVQTYLNNKTQFKPTIELSGDVYLQDDKVARVNPNGSYQTDNSVNGMINLFAGSSYHPTQQLYVSLVGGPSFVSGQTLLGIKPSFGYYFSKTQKLTARVSYINVFNRGDAKENFTSLSFALGLKLF